MSGGGREARGRGEQSPVAVLIGPPGAGKSTVGALLAALAAGSRQRTGSASTRAASSGRGTAPSGAKTGPIATTWLTISMPYACRR